MPGYIPPISVHKVSNPFAMEGIGKHFQLDMPSDVPKTSFKAVMNQVVENVNETLGAPDKLMNEAMTTGSVDVHDVMVANAKSELAVNITTQVATKVVQAYDRILQIQI